MAMPELLMVHYQGSERLLIASPGSQKFILQLYPEIDEKNQILRM